LGLPDNRPKITKEPDNRPELPQERAKRQVKEPGRTRRARKAPHATKGAGIREAPYVKSCLFPPSGGLPTMLFAENRQLLSVSASISTFEHRSIPLQTGIISPVSVAWPSGCEIASMRHFTCPQNNATFCP